jgi:hypothetical protein
MLQNLQNKGNLRLILTVYLIRLSYEITLHRKTILLKGTTTLKWKLDLLHIKVIEFSAQGKNFHNIFENFCTLPGYSEDYRHACVGLVLCLWLMYFSLPIASGAMLTWKVTIIFEHGGAEGFHWLWEVFWGGGRFNYCTWESIPRHWEVVSKNSVRNWKRLITQAEQVFT